MTSIRGSWAMVVAAWAIATCGAGCDGGAPPGPAIDAATAIDAAEPIDGAMAPPDAAGGDAGPGDASPGSDGGRVLAGENGAPCAEADDCRSSSEPSDDVPACIMGGTWDNGFGWVSGYCASACGAPPAIEDGVPLERRGCPGGSLCTPMTHGIGGVVYDFGVCLRGCATDDDCRTDEGYFCRRDWRSGIETPNGVCMPSHCHSRGCPGSAVCSC